MTRPPLLFLARDDDTLVVSTRPLKVTGRGAQAGRAGPLVLMSPAEPRAPGWTGREIRGFGVLCLLFAFALGAFGSRWWPGLAVPGVLLMVASVFRETERKPGRVRGGADRRPETCRQLTATPERETMMRAVALIERISAAWPALGAMVEQTSAERALADLTFALAGLLEQRERLRRTRDDLRSQSHAGLPATNPAVRSLAAQTARADDAIERVEAQISRRFAALEKVAAATGTFLREEALRRAARDAEQVLAEFDDPGPGPEPGAALAEQVEAVLTAYRELTDKP